MNMTEIERKIDLGEDDYGGPEDGAYVTVTIKACGEWERAKTRVEALVDDIKEHEV